MKAHRIPGLDRWAARAAAALIAAVVAVAGCGGGVGVGGTGGFASGPITGFGSIIVSGIEFDDSSAYVEDEDGTPSSRAALRLGMFAEVESGVVGGSADAPTAVATRVRYGSELIGPAGGVDVAGGSFSVLGQTVRADAATVFDERYARGLADVADGSVVEVYGAFDPARGAYVATRVEPRPAAPPFYKVRGPVRALDTAARTFSIGAIALAYTAAPAGLAEGGFVRVQLETLPVAGRWVVRGFGDGQRRVPDTDRARLRGTVTAFSSSRAFSVDGRVVDAAAARFPDGEAGVALGVQVEVEGPVVGGVLHATEVGIDDHGGAQGGFELKGEIGSLQPAQQTFVLRGVTVFYGGPALQFEDGGAADIADGAKVEVLGRLTGGGTRLLATRIRFKG